MTIKLSWQNRSLHIWVKNSKCPHLEQASLYTTQLSNFFKESAEYLLDWLLC